MSPLRPWNFNKIQAIENMQLIRGFQGRKVRAHQGCKRVRAQGRKGDKGESEKDGALLKESQYRHGFVVEGSHPLPL